MIVPQYWAEGRVQERVKGKQVTIRRFGWSDVSQADAQASADIRAREALLRHLGGDQIVRREPKVAYNGAEGVPIREEILSRHGEAIITRNLYGARCLNTPNVLFADVDFEQELSRNFGCAMIVLFVFAAVAFGFKTHAGILTLFFALIALFLGYSMAAFCQKTYLRLRGGMERLTRNRLSAFLRKHTDWQVRLYRTPAGLRILAMHRTFQPDEPPVTEFFRALAADPVYVKMCQRQKCFRARLTPKPWRIGISQHLRPRPGVWPVNPERLPERTRWIEAYEAAARGHAACAYVETLGTGMTAPAALAVQRLHDEVCQATSGLPVA